LDVVTCAVNDVVTCAVNDRVACAVNDVEVIVASWVVGMGVTVVLDDVVTDEACEAAEAEGPSGREVDPVEVITEDKVDVLGGVGGGCGVAVPAGVTVCAPGHGLLLGFCLQKSLLAL
jgi:hypothetical protein